MPIILKKQSNANIAQASDLVTGSFDSATEYYLKVIDSLNEVDEIEIEVTSCNLDETINLFSEASVDKNIYFVVLDKVKSFYDEIKEDLNIYIESNLLKPHHKSFLKQSRQVSNDSIFAGSFANKSESLNEICDSFEEDFCCLSALNFELDESFSEYLIHLIDEKGLTDPYVYKKANMDRKLFNHIKNDLGYKPRKETCIALGIALELDEKGMNNLLEKAGYILSNSSLFDVIIKYCLENNVYDINKINEILFENDQKLLG